MEVKTELDLIQFSCRTKLVKAEEDPLHFK
jgi:hypothetical protein